MSDPLDPVLSEIEAFLVASRMSATTFGYEASRDPTLVHELRKGRECRRSTREKIRAFIRDERAKIAAAA